MAVDKPFTGAVLTLLLLHALLTFDPGEGTTPTTPEAPGPSTSGLSSSGEAASAGVTGVTEIETTAGIDDVTGVDTTENITDVTGVETTTDTQTSQSPLETTSSFSVPGLDVVLPSSNSTGYIQTSNLDGRTYYENRTDACVTLPVPANHTVMISFPFFDLEDNDCQYDYVELYLKDSCGNSSGRPFRVVCQGVTYEPRVYEAEVFSVRFYSDSSVQRTGFKLRFSFHGAAQQPVEVSTGKWDCRGPGASLLLQHLICSVHSSCAGGEDRALVACPSDVCGPAVISVGGSCYRHVRTDRGISWKEAETSCDGYNSHLASLDSQREWDSVVGWMRQVTLPDDVYFIVVGLKLGHPSTYPYSAVWQWSDETIALYYDITQLNADIPFYSVFRQSSMGFITITEEARFYGHYLCEIHTESQQTGQPSVISLPTLPVPASAEQGLAECEGNVATRDFLDCGTAADDCGDYMADPATARFTCDDGGCVPFTLVCDFRQHCEDGSDEYCQFQVCSNLEFSCDDSNQCIPVQYHCDGTRHCVDGSDEVNCQTLWRSLDWMSITPPPPAIVDFTASGTLNIAPLNTSTATCPDTHFWCPGEDYCLPVYVRCNAVYDCPSHEDEEGCEGYTCPGFYRCRNSAICIHADHVCDGMLQCPEHDDEVACNMTCPHSCQCYGLVFVCAGKFPAADYPDLKYLNADGSGMKLQDVSGNRWLVHLSLRNCNITGIATADFPNLKSLDLSHNALVGFRAVDLQNLKFLDLSYNSLIQFSETSFQNLEVLDLSYNSITNISLAGLARLGSLRTLSLAQNRFLSLNFITNTTIFLELTSVNFSSVIIEEITDSFLEMFPDIQYLNLSGCDVEKMSTKGFTELRELKVLDVTGCPMTDFSQDLFKGLQHMEAIFADNYRLCCPAILPDGFCSDKCRAKADEISSCDALLRTDIFRFFLIVYTVLTLVGNLASFLYRVLGKQGARKQLGFDVFVTHLCVSDFLMGVYLAIIGMADRWYFGSYSFNDRKWTHSVTCKLAGYLSFVSSEVSAFLICFITLERLLIIRFPHSNLHFTARSAGVASVAGWVVGAGLAAVPLLPVTDHWQFYSQSGICIPLPITRKVFPGSDYSFYVMIVANFVLFLFIAFGQLLIFWSYYAQSKAVSSSGKRTKDMAIARRLLVVAMSDFLCWFPIGVLGLMARFGVSISGDVNVAMAIFVLPFNSAVNPLLYTLPKVREQRRQAKTMKSREHATITRTEHSVEGAPSSSAAKQQEHSLQKEQYKPEEAWQLMVKFLKDGRVKPEQVKLHLGSSSGQSQDDMVKEADITSDQAWQLLVKFLHDGRVTFEQVKRHCQEHSNSELVTKF